jgi:tetratricopeptide (TPR) repeat protein
LFRQTSSLWLFVVLILVTECGCAPSQTPARDPSAAWQQSYDAGRDAYGRADYGQAQKLFAAAVDEAERFGDRDPRLGRSLNDLAAAYAVQGNYADAEPLYQRSLAILEKAYGPDNLIVAIALRNYADLLQATNRGAEAAQLQARASAIQQKAGR